MPPPSVPHPAPPQLLPTFDPDKQRQLLRHLPRWLPLADAPGPVADRLRAWALALAAPGVTAAPDLLGSPALHTGRQCLHTSCSSALGVSVLCNP